MDRAAQAMSRDPDLQRQIDATRDYYRQMRENPMTPSGLTARGQSGSLLDYREDEEIGTMICAAEGHSWGHGENPQVYRFCSRCGIRQRKTTGEETRLWAVAARWIAEDAAQ